MPIIFFAHKWDYGELFSPYIKESYFSLLSNQRMKSICLDINQLIVALGGAISLEY